MATDGFIYLAAAMFLITIGMIIWAAYEYFRFREEEKPNAPVILNFASHETGKRFEGREIKSESGVHGRQLITYKPKDIDLKNLSRKQRKDKLKNQVAIVDPNKIISVSPGVLSQDKHLKFLLADDINHYPESFRDSLLGRGLIWATMEANVNKTVEDMFRESISSRDEILKKINDGEMTREMLQTMENLMKDSLKLRVSEHLDRKEKSTIIPSIGGLTGGQSP